MLPGGLRGRKTGEVKRFGLIKSGPLAGINNFTDTCPPRRILYAVSPPQRCMRDLSLMSAVPVRPTRSEATGTHRVIRATNSFHNPTALRSDTIAQRRGFGWIVKSLRNRLKFRHGSAKQEDHSGTPNEERKGDETKPSSQMASHHTPIHSPPAHRNGPHHIEGDTNVESLTEEQQIVLDLVLREGKSIFFTGPAGTGKSFLLRKIIEAVEIKHITDMETVAVTASTGIAATHIRGQTLHSFTGIGLGNDTVEELIVKIWKSKKIKHRWTAVKVLILDEVSMIDARLFDKLERIAREVRRNELPFGGIQLVVAGDFFQLPPVAKGQEAQFAFEAKSWARTIEHTIGLTHVFRQKDPIFSSMLNEMREGRLSFDSIQQLKQLSRPLRLTGGLEASNLFALCAEVNMANHSRLDQLPGEVRTYTSQDWGTKDEKTREKLLAGCITPRVLRVKKGAQVMLTRNLFRPLVNGSLGQIMDFEEGSGSEIQYPRVRFTCIDGAVREILCTPETWIIEEPPPSSGKRPNEKTRVLAGRRQVPLILAWALSIHKAQGQSLDFVRVDLTNVFERHQAYVALSRATTMEGLQVLNFDPKKVLAHERVKAFYKTLSTTDATKKLLRCKSGLKGWD
ncbi:mitochondrial dna helicase [Diplodia corticola]|uniref:ATP-dependent DNA helicase PIF1 n=1 Tax=Diplodia corticola TaxID=236234 RepID=A0A1J9QLP1_9PEZI|nr:mitochondrial dna helicase [Diplodia corticola]OJD28986.1 mitochondrial dna helicase [Diplodia corticola]